MFETLVETGHQASSPKRAGAIAVALHAGIIVLAAQRAGDTPMPNARTEPIDIMIYDEPPARTDLPFVDGTSEMIVQTAPTLTTPGPISIEIGTINMDVPLNRGSDLRGQVLDDARSTGLAILNDGVVRSAGTGIHLVGEVDEPVKVITPALLVYPRALEAAGIPGRVVLQYVVDTLGQVEPNTMRMVEASDSLFAQASRDAVSRTRFAPARARGVVVRQLVRQAMAFTIGKS